MNYDPERICALALALEKAVDALEILSANDREYLYSRLMTLGVNKAAGYSPEQQQRIANHYAGEKLRNLA